MRIAKLKANPFSDEGGLMTEWHHFPCIFETWARARVKTFFKVTKYVSMCYKKYCKGLSLHVILTTYTLL